MPVSTKHPMAIEAEARKIEARNGGSITKNRMKPATSGDDARDYREDHAHRAQLPHRGAQTQKQVGG